MSGQVTFPPEILGIGSHNSKLYVFNHKKNSLAGCIAGPKINECRWHYPRSILEIFAFGHSLTTVTGLDRVLVRNFFLSTSDRHPDRPSARQTNITFVIPTRPTKGHGLVWTDYYWPHWTYPTPLGVPLKHLFMFFLSDFLATMLSEVFLADIMSVFIEFLTLDEEAVIDWGRYCISIEERKLQSGRIWFFKMNYGVFDELAQRVTPKRMIFDSVPKPDCPRKNDRCTAWKELEQSGADEYKMCESRCKDHPHPRCRRCHWLSKPEFSRLTWFNSLVTFCKRRFDSVRSTSLSCTPSSISRGSKWRQQKGGINWRTCEVASALFTLYLSFVELRGSYSYL